MSTKEGPVFTFSLPGRAACPPSVTPLPVTSFHIRNQDPLLMDICLLQGTQIMTLFYLARLLSVT